MPSWIDVDGIGLRYDVEGAGSRTFVFVNAMGTTVESWDELLDAMPDRARILRYDMRGTGLSERIVGPYDFEQAVSDLAGLVSAVVPVESHLVLIGAALGGAVALALAARQKRVVGLVLLAPVTGIAKEGHAALLKRSEVVAAAGMRRFVESEILPGAYPEILRADRPRFERFRLRHLANDASSYACTQRMLATIDLSSACLKVACPVLVLSGTHDAARPPETARFALAGLRDVQFETVNSGHFMATQSPEIVAPLVSRFLAGLS